MSDEEKKAIEKLKWYFEDSQGLDITKQATIVLNLIEKQSKEIERLNEILIWKQKHEEQLQKEIERLNNKFEKIYNEIDNKNSQLVKALNYKLFIEDKIKAKIEEYEQDVKDFEEYWSKDPRKFKKEKSVDYYKLEALKELLEKE